MEKINKKKDCCKWPKKSPTTLFFPHFWKGAAKIFLHFIFCAVLHHTDLETFLKSVTHDNRLCVLSWKIFNMAKKSNVLWFLRLPGTIASNSYLLLLEFFLYRRNRNHRFQTKNTLVVHRRTVFISFILPNQWNTDFNIAFGLSHETAMCI